MRIIFIKHTLLKQIIKFSLIGAFNFLIDLFIYLFLTRKLFFYYILAHITSFLVANSISFILNKKLAFNDHSKKNLTKKYIKFLSLTSLSLLISLTTLFICVYYFKIFDIYGKIIGTILAAIWNFTMYKLVVFQTKR